VQRPENKHWRGFAADAFGYNGLPTRSCHLLLEGASTMFDAPIFLPSAQRSRAFTPLRDVSFR